MVETGATNDEELMERARSVQDYDWREQIKMEIQEEIERQVREALDTPPLERLRRNNEKAKERRHLSADFDAESTATNGNETASSQQEQKLLKTAGKNLRFNLKGGQLSETMHYTPASKIGAAERNRQSLAAVRKYSGDARLKIWQTHQKLNAHVETMIDNARKSKVKNGKLFNYAENLIDSASKGQKSGLSRSQELEFLRGDTALNSARLPNKYKMLLNNQQKSEAESDIDSEDEENSDSDQRSTPQKKSAQTPVRKSSLTSPRKANGKDVIGSNDSGASDQNNSKKTVGGGNLLGDQRGLSTEYSETPSKIYRIGVEAFQNFGSLTEKERIMFFSNFTQRGFNTILRSGKLPDGTPVDIIQIGKRKAFKDRYGLVRDNYGPFWPKEFGPLHASPVHKRFTNAFSRLQEPLALESTAEFVSAIANATSGQLQTGSSTNAGAGANANSSTNTSANTNPNNDTQWSAPITVYDIERSNRECALINCTSPVRNLDTEQNSLNRVIQLQPLSFESRFECGNLRQARRIGERTYELVVNCDLNTARHTQWYYFRVRNAVPGVMYRFIFVNFMKPTSLYNQGMQPLLYSEKKAKNEEIGWYRTGQHISYSKNVDNRSNPLLRSSSDDYYQLDYCIKFPYEGDTCYLAHCYPYSFTDLKNDLDLLLVQRSRAECMKRDVLCETPIGNACFLLTITNFNSGEDLTAPSDATDAELMDLKARNKKVVVLTGRVHPGESNSSWMMKGLIEFLTSNDEVAVKLRDELVFKVVPMLNPDGVIVGNYRCSLTGRDMNRNYRHPTQHRFPSVWYTKEMIRQLSRDHQVLLYCDLHGHSRQSNSFLYGCDSSHLQENDCNFDVRRVGKGTTERFLNERVFAWLMATQAGPELFAFNGCKYSIRPCKESTGRVVMWRQFAIECSFTLEVSFSGMAPRQLAARHFRTSDLENVGCSLVKTISAYCKLLADQTFREKTFVQLMTYYIETGQLNRAEPPSQSAENTSRSPADAEKVFDQFDNWFTNRKGGEILAENASDCDSNSDAERELISDPESEANEQQDVLVERSSKPERKKVAKHSRKRLSTKQNGGNSVVFDGSQRRMSQPIFPVTFKSKLFNDKSEHLTSQLNEHDADGLLMKPAVQHLDTLQNGPNGASKSEDLAARKFVNPYEKVSNNGIPCFALKRALDRTEIKLGRLRQKFENDPEKLDALEHEYSKQINQIQKRLNELTSMPTSITSSLTIVLDDNCNLFDCNLDQEQGDESESGTSRERHVSLRSILFEPEYLLSEVKPDLVVNGSRGQKFRAVKLSNANNAISRLMAPSGADQNRSRRQLKQLQSSASRDPDASSFDASILLSAARLANGKPGQQQQQQLQLQPTLGNRVRDLLAGSNSSASTEARELPHEGSGLSVNTRHSEVFPSSKRALRNEPLSLSGFASYSKQSSDYRLLQQRSLDRDRDSLNKTVGLTQAEKMILDQRYNAQQATLRWLPEVAANSSSINHRSRRMLPSLGRNYE